jgi:hypothetical protein
MIDQKNQEFGSVWKFMEKSNSVTLKKEEKISVGVGICAIFW